MIQKIALVVIILTVSCLFLFPSTSKAEISLSGTVTPGQSIQEAINNASEGETIHIQSGTYQTGGYPIIVNKSVTLMGENVETTIIDGSEVATHVFLVIVDGVKIENLTVRNTTTIGGSGICVGNVRNVEVSSCIIEQCCDGIELKNSTYCKITRNQIVDNYYNGIYLHVNSSRNLIVGNTIMNNTVGVNIDYPCQDNVFYHNNFVSNEKQQDGLGRTANNWNSTYPFGGNYWGDYTGIDMYSGVYQNENCSDGIVDAPYTIYEACKDFYPLMAPVHFFDAGEWNGKSYCVILATKSNVSSFHFNLNDPPFIMFNFTDSDINSSYRVSIPRQLLWVNSSSDWRVLVNSQQVAVNFTETDENYTYLFFTCNSEVTSVTIIGTGVIPEFTQYTFLFTLLVATLLAMLLAKAARSRSK